MCFDYYFSVISAQDSDQKKEILDARKEEKEKIKNRKECAKQGFESIRDNRCYETFPTDLMTWGKGFSNGLGKITVDGKAGFINIKGEMVIKPTLKDAGQFSEDLAPFESKSGKWGFIDKVGKVVIKPQFNWAVSFHEGLALVQIGELWGYIDHSGKVVIEPKFEEASSFEEGFAIVGYYDKDYVWTTHKRPNGKWQKNFIDKTGQFKFSTPFDGISRNFNGGMALVSRNISYKNGVISQSYFIDQYGNELWKWNSSLTWFSDDLIVVTVNYDKETKRESYSFLDRNGKRVTDKTFSYLAGFYEGLSTARIAWEDKLGFINKKGDFVIEPKFNWAKSFSEGLAGAEEQYKGYGFIDKSGNWAIEPQFEWVDYFQEGFALVAPRGNPEAKEKTGYIDRSGRYIWKPTK